MKFKKPLSGIALWYFRSLARIQIKKIKPLVIGIGGSSGKSSTCSLLSLVLSRKYKVKNSRGKNSETGIPLTILGVEPLKYGVLDWLRMLTLSSVKVLFDSEKYDVYVAEMGIDGPNEPKNMDYLLKIVKPKIAALTNITWEHSVYFDEVIKEKDEKKRAKKILEKTASEEIKLLTNLGPTDTAIVNIDDKIIYSGIKDIKAKKITISTKNKSVDLHGEPVSDFEKFEMDIKFQDKDYKLSLAFPLPTHYAYSFLIVLAISTLEGISIKDAISSLEENFYLPPGRFSIFNGIKNTKIIDSTYNNATIIPIMDILDFVKTSKARKVGIIGDMRELGSVSRILHQRLAKKLQDCLDIAFLIGDSMVDYAKPDTSKDNFYAFRTFSEARDSILKNIKEGDLILVKGSQNKLFLERTVEMLLKDKKDVQKLCRRGEFWDNKRKETL